MRHRMAMADAPVLYRVKMTRISPEGEVHTWYEGPYPKAAGARGRLTFWQNHYASTRGPAWKVSGEQQEAPMAWETSED